MTIRHMQQELTQWGNWARSTEKNGGLKQYESPAYTWLRQNVAQEQSRSPRILDDDALLAIDALIGMLKRSKPTLYNFISMFYLKGYSVKYIAGRAGISRPIVDKYLLAAETWLDCKLETLCEMAERTALTC